MLSKYANTLGKWHEFVKSRGENMNLLSTILADEVVFHSPVVWTPQEGKKITMKYLTSAAEVLEDFTYHREFVSEDSVALEFTARIGQMTVKAIDIIKFNPEGQIIDFEVMARPAKGLQALAAAMAEKLAQKV
jgi:hypothetical protein